MLPAADITKKKHDEEAAPRFPEEEGLFVGQRPFVQDKCLHKMENRLINEGDQVSSAAASFSRCCK